MDFCKFSGLTMTEEVWCCDYWTMYSIGGFLEGKVFTMTKFTRLGEEPKP